MNDWFKKAGIVLYILSYIRKFVFLNYVCMCFCFGSEYIQDCIKERPDQGFSPSILLSTKVIRAYTTFKKFFITISLKND